ncbi:roadblock/LC7 domain-containing protein [Deinococcus peraridilitoris]|uniref:Roadblock/LAMTOR2 domain-containing protein n=1 Tax=Deinococcus peraridilitoris (strain DSM 19664 / LMG 22246 / CIP 109416 / KR-200) TaxID=937777 RepID=K9ZZB0_DEIPD|nr:roadblock/LC7 domain-containing protein [Deinococcus peraridilitoris]AFZ66534.1 hypothetical protein Deipe_0966 [Deinococcus peraridilitoris DSM 19664]
MKLRALMGTPGVRSAALVGRDGLALEAYGDKGEHLAAELASLRESLERLARRLGSGALSRIAFTTEHFEVVAVSVGDFITGVALTRGSDTRAAQLELARVALELAPQAALGER